MKQGSLLKLWMDENASQQSNEKFLMKENLQYHRNQQPNCLELLEKGNRNRGAQQVK